MPDEETQDEQTNDATAATVEDVVPKTSGRDAAIAAERRKAKAAEKRAEDAERRLAEQARKEQEAEGRWEEIAKAAEKRAEDLEAKAAARDKREAITAAATRLKFKNPALAHKLLDDDDVADEQTAERALTRLTKAEPYLLQGTPSRTGVPASDSGESHAEEKDPYARAGLAVIDLIEQSRSGRPG